MALLRQYLIQSSLRVVSRISNIPSFPSSLFLFLSGCSFSFSFTGPSSSFGLQILNFISSYPLGWGSHHPVSINTICILNLIQIFQIYIFSSDLPPDSSPAYSMSPLWSWRGISKLMCLITWLPPSNLLLSVFSFSANGNSILPAAQPASLEYSLILLLVLYPVSDASANSIHTVFKLYPESDYFQCFHPVPNYHLSPRLF